MSLINNNNKNENNTINNNSNININTNGSSLDDVNGGRYHQHHRIDNYNNNNNTINYYQNYLQYIQQNSLLGTRYDIPMNQYNCSREANDSILTTNNNTYNINNSHPTTIAPTVTVHDEELIQQPLHQQQQQQQQRRRRNQQRFQNNDDSIDYNTTTTEKNDYSNNSSSNNQQPIHRTNSDYSSSSNNSRSISPTLQTHKNKTSVTVGGHHNDNDEYELLSPDQSDDNESHSHNNSNNHSTTSIRQYLQRLQVLLLVAQMKQYICVYYQYIILQSNSKSKQVVQVNVQKLYTKNDWYKDIFAGIIVTFMEIPQSMSYAKLAGLPVQYGLYSAITPAFAYALFGTCPQLAIGPVALLSLLVNTGLTSILSNYNTTTTNTSITNSIPYEQLYEQLAIQCALFTGIGMILLGLLPGFGKAITTLLLPKPIISGFTTGAAITIALSQFKYILGYTSIKSSSDTIHTILYIYWQNRSQFHFPSFLFGSSCIIILYYMKSFGAGTKINTIINSSTSTTKENKHKSNICTSKINHFYSLIFGTTTATTTRNSNNNSWMKAMGPLLVTVGGIISTMYLLPQSYMIPIVGTIPKGFPSITIGQWIPYNNKNNNNNTGQDDEDDNYVFKLLYGTVISIILVAYIESYAMAQQLANRTYNDIKNNKKEEDKLPLVVVVDSDEVLNPVGATTMLVHEEQDLQRGVEDQRKGDIVIVDETVQLSSSTTTCTTTASNSSTRLPIQPPTVDSASELIALGFANIVGSAFGGYPVCGSLSRSAVNYESGAVSVRSGVISGILVLFTITFFTEIIKYMPLCALASIVITGVLPGLLDISTAITLYNTYYIDFIVWCIAFIGTLFIGVELGLFCAILFNFCTFFYTSAYPTIVTLGRLHGTTHYTRIQSSALTKMRNSTTSSINDSNSNSNSNNHQSDPSMSIIEEYPNIWIVQLSVPLFFANAQYVHDTLIQTLQKKQQSSFDSPINAMSTVDAVDQTTNTIGPNLQDHFPICSTSTKATSLIIDMTSVAYMDTTGLQFLTMIADYIIVLNSSCNDHSTVLPKSSPLLCLVNPTETVKQMIVCVSNRSQQQSNEVSLLEKTKLFSSTHDAVLYCFELFDQIHQTQQNQHRQKVMKQQPKTTPSPPPPNNLSIISKMIAVSNNTNNISIDQQMII